MGKRTTVLVVDDNREMCDTVSQILELGPEFKVVSRAKNGLEGIALAHKLRPDVILMNCSMPYVDGIEATRRIMRQIPNAAIIMMSYHDDPGLIASAWEAGIKAYFLKPIMNLEALYDTIRLVKEQRDAERATQLRAAIRKLETGTVLSER